MPLLADGVYGQLFPTYATVNKVASRYMVNTNVFALDDATLGIPTIQQKPQQYQVWRTAAEASVFNIFQQHAKAAALTS